ncbi:protein TonB [Robiginitalea myxolifaciens]|uniref:Protein TonB n=1 Tax=Robiginitalea myxolifaciens TaxID=400055 RepID=A0A1I6FTB1_9FLAO|nr:energy transducer TonB [Robiginitalea myxolifaciens]SFR33144.1 protein TonB [Robiginitalea myxolifaciens]
MKNEADYNENKNHNKEEETVPKRIPSYLLKARANLPKNGPIRFQIGLILAMTVSYIALEWIFPLKEDPAPPPLELLEEQVFYLQEQQEEPPKIMALATPEPVRKPLQRIVVDKTEAPAIEKEDIPISLSLTPPAPPGPRITPEAPKEEQYYTMLNVQELPVFPGCEKVSSEERFACFQAGLKKHIKRNFRYPDAAVVTGQQGRVYVEFVISKTGEIGGLKLRGPAPVLEKEASRIINRLPQMIPGKVRGIPVPVRFAVPINFVLGQ